MDLEGTTTPAMPERRAVPIADSLPGGNLSCACGKATKAGQRFCDVHHRKVADVVRRRLGRLWGGRYARHIEDVTQSCFLRLEEPGVLERFAARPEIEDSFGGWLSTVVRRWCMHEIRRLEPGFGGSDDVTVWPIGLNSSAPSADAAYHRELLLQFCNDAVEQVRRAWYAKGKERAARFDALLPEVLDGAPDYTYVRTVLDMSPGNSRRGASDLKRDLRVRARALVRDTISIRPGAGREEIEAAITREIADSFEQAFSDELKRGDVEAAQARADSFGPPETER
jgi:hypothetical protein